MFGTQRLGNGYLAGTAEFEYGVKAWWTSEFYLDGQSTFGDSALFTGFRWAYTMAEGAAALEYRACRQTKSRLREGSSARARN